MSPVPDEWMVHVNAVRMRSHCTMVSVTMLELAHRARAHSRRSNAAHNVPTLARQITILLLEEP